MSTVITRLKASKSEYDAARFASGKYAGRKWAEEEADYDGLRKISMVEVPDHGADVGKGLGYGLEMEIRSEGFLDYAGISVELADEPAYLYGFIVGAREVYNEVYFELHPQF